MHAKERLKAQSIRIFQIFSAQSLQTAGPHRPKKSIGNKNPRITKGESSINGWAPSMKNKKTVQSSPTTPNYTNIIDNNNINNNKSLCIKSLCENLIYSAKQEASYGIYFIITTETLTLVRVTQTSKSHHNHK